LGGRALAQGIAKGARDQGGLHGAINPLLLGGVQNKWQLELDSDKVDNNKK